MMESFLNKVKLLCKKMIVSEQEVYLVKNVCDDVDSPDLILGGGYSVKTIDSLNAQDVERFRCLVNNAYEDANYTYSKARSLLLEHPFLTNTETIIFFEGVIPIATISYGLYRNNPEVGGCFRIAVQKDQRKKGIGSKMVRFAERQLVTNKKVYKIMETIKYKRTPSLLMHFKLGYIPMDYKDVPFKRAQKRVIAFYDKWKTHETR